MFCIQIISRLSTEKFAAVRTETFKLGPKCSYLSFAAVFLEISVDSINCLLVPTLKKPPNADYFSATVPDISFSNDLVQTEFYGSSVFVFLKYKDSFTNTTKIYRDEYLGWIFQPWAQVKTGSRNGVYTRIFLMPKFTYVGSNPQKTIFNVTARYGGILDVDYTFFVGDPEPDVVRWDFRSVSLLNATYGATIGILQQYVFRMQHSGNVPLGCIKSEIFLYTNCSSDVAKANFVRRGLSSDLLKTTPNLFHVRY